MMIASEPLAAASAAQPLTVTSEDLLGLSQALNIPPGSGAEDSLIALVSRLDSLEYFQYFFSCFLGNYTGKWEAHNPNPATVIAKMGPVWRSFHGDFSDLPLRFTPGSIRLFPHCLVTWAYYSFAEMQALMPVHGDHFMWYPESREHRDAFTYAFFLLMCLRDEDTDEDVLEMIQELYEGALDYLRHLSAIN
ncbi:hypothetical protein F4777DRAFT_129356 [Nemania sp. FL0916]|nr:hypothetical protein F4777DRAFT_129356 [Nemania sp. FL0916]